MKIETTVIYRDALGGPVFWADMPEGSRILSVGEKAGGWCVWFIEGKGKVKPMPLMCFADNSDYDDSEGESWLGDYIGRIEWRTGQVVHVFKRYDYDNPEAEPTNLGDARPKDKPSELPNTDT